MTDKLLREQTSRELAVVAVVFAAPDRIGIGARPTRPIACTTFWAVSCRLLLSPAVSCCLFLGGCSPAALPTAAPAS